MVTLTAVTFRLTKRAFPENHTMLFTLASSYASNEMNRG